MAKKEPPKPKEISMTMLGWTDSNYRKLEEALGAASLDPALLVEAAEFDTEIAHVEEESVIFTGADHTVRVNGITLKDFIENHDEDDYFWGWCDPVDDVEFFQMVRRATKPIMKLEVEDIEEQILPTSILGTQRNPDKFGFWKNPTRSDRQSHADLRPWVITRREHKQHNQKRMKLAI